MRWERWYRLFLLIYPASYRRHRAEEMLDVLLANEYRGGRWSRLAEVASLLANGIRVRLGRPEAGPKFSPAIRLAGACMTCLLGVLGAEELLTMAARGLGVGGYSDPGDFELWVDPRWPVQALWLTAALGFLLRRSRVTVMCAWLAAGLHVWLLGATSLTPPQMPWVGNVGPYWLTSGGVAEGTWAVLSVATAVMLGGPGGVVRSRAGLSHDRWCVGVATGVIGACLVQAAGPMAPAAGHLGANLASVHVRESLPLLLAAAVLGRGLVRSRQGRLTLILMGPVAAIPLGARWTNTMSTIVAVSLTALMLLIAGCVAGAILGTPRVARQPPTPRGPVGHGQAEQ